MSETELQQLKHSLASIQKELHEFRAIFEESKYALAHDAEFAKRVEKAWEKYESGKLIKKNKDAFLKELGTW